MDRWLDRVRGRQRERGEPPAPDGVHQGPNRPAARVSAPTPPDLYGIRHTPRRRADPFRAWYHRNAELLTDDDRRVGHDRGGFCVEHNRWLSYPEQERGACSWCVPVDPDRKPEYWASHWRRFGERRKDGRG